MFSTHRMLKTSFWVLTNKNHFGHYHLRSILFLARKNIFAAIFLQDEKTITMKALHMKTIKYVSTEMKSDGIQSLLLVMTSCFHAFSKKWDRPDVYAEDYMTLFKNSENQICAGTNISPKMILTNAQCLCESCYAFVLMCFKKR